MREEDRRGGRASPEGLRCSGHSCGPDELSPCATLPHSGVCAHLQGGRAHERSLVLSKARRAEGPITFSSGEMLSFGEDRAHIWSSFCILLRVEGRNHIRSLPPLAPAPGALVCMQWVLNKYLWGD